MSKFYNQTVEEVLNNLGTDTVKGLTDIQVKAGITKYGKNEFSKKEEETLFDKIKAYLLEPLMVILLLSALVSALIGQGHEAIGIICAIALGATVGIITDGKSKKAADALSKLTGDIEVKSLRDEKVIKVHKSDLVPGDIVYLEAGDMVPADGRLLTTMDLKVREDMLTGESDDVKKDATVVVQMTEIDNNGTLVVQEPIPALQKNMVFGGTLIASGRGTMVVTATGDHSEMGKIAQNLNEDSETPLQVKLGDLGAKIAKASSVIAGLLFIYTIGRAYLNGSLSFDLVKDTFTICVALIVAAVPEGLPTMINMTLAMAMQRMSKINALVTKKEACETIGAVSVICSDKTGTLTENRMTVEAVEITGRFFEDNCLYNSTADISFDENNKPVYMGSATECALLLKMKDKGIDYKESRKNVNIVAQEQFSSATKQMSTTVEINGNKVKLIKGAPEVLLEQATHLEKDGVICPLTDEMRKEVIANIAVLQEKSMRVLGFSYVEVDTQDNEIFSGFVGIKDPLRSDVADAVKTAKAAGVSTKMLTGDNIVTAKAIGEELGLLDGGMRAVEATYIDTLSDDELRKEIETIAIVARSKPDTKMRVVSALQANTEVVAVTGDGINDAPALSKADVGIAMGISGTEVSKGAADIILTDDSFSTIVKGIQWGRGIFENIQRFVQFQLAVNIVAFLVAIVCTVTGKEMPFTTIQLLWVNIIMDGPPALALGMEPVRNHVLDRKPISREASIFTKSMATTFILNAIFIASVILVQEHFNFLGATQAEMGTVLFALFAFSALFNALNAREFGTDSIFPNFTKNTVILKVLAVTGIAQIVFTNVFQSFFNSVALGPVMWLKVLATSASIIVVNELVKLVIRTVKKK